MSETLKAFAEAARKLASTMAARDVVQRSLDGIIAEQERRAAAKAAVQKAKETQSWIASCPKAFNEPRLNNS